MTHEGLEVPLDLSTRHRVAGPSSHCLPFFIHFTVFSVERILHTRSVFETLNVFKFTHTF